MLDAKRVLALSSVADTFFCFYAYPQAAIEPIL